MEHKDEQKKLRRRKGLRGLLLAVSVVLVTMIVSDLVSLVRFNRAGKLHQQGQFDEAIAAYQELGTFRQADRMAYAVRYDKALALREAGEYDQALDIFIRLRYFSDAPQQYLATLYRKGEHLAGIGDYQGAYEAFWELAIPEPYEDSPARMTETGLLYARQLWEAGDYPQAISVLNLLENTPETAQAQLACCTEYASILCGEGSYAQAYEVYTTPEGFSQDTDLYFELVYRKGLASLEEKQYEDAVSWLDRLRNYRDSERKRNEAMYAFVLDTYDQWKAEQAQGKESALFRLDTAADYLNDLCAVRFLDAQEIADQVYSWRIKVLAFNNDKSDKQTNMASISKMDGWYCHFVLLGGRPGSQVRLSYQTTFPNGITNRGKLMFDMSYGDMTYVNGRYSNKPQEGKTGTFQVELYDEQGVCIGSASVEITD